jgi:gas vesicle protein
MGLAKRLCWTSKKEELGMARLLSFLAGIGIGTAVGMLFAPASGEEAREAIRAKAEEGRDYLTDRAQRAREQAGQWADRGRQVVNEQKQTFREAYETGRQAYQEATTPKTGTSS